MTETVDQAQAQPPRALAGVIEDATSLSCVSTSHFEGSRGGRLASRRRRIPAKQSHQHRYPIHHFRGREPQDARLDDTSSAAPVKLTVRPQRFPGVASLAGVVLLLPAWPYRLLSVPVWARFGWVSRTVWPGDRRGLPVPGRVVGGRGITGGEAAHDVTPGYPGAARSGTAAGIGTGSYRWIPAPRALRAP